MIKAIVFDIGYTLIQYYNPMSWQSMYIPALEQVAQKCNFVLSDSDYDKAIQILTKYNTRVNPREREYSSTTIFTEIFNAWGKDIKDIEMATIAFYSFFCNGSNPFEEVVSVLQKIKSKGIYTATLSDVPYGIDNKFALNDISEIIQYFDLPLTSNDIGYRKPNTTGLLYIADKFNIKPEEILFVGDESKDVICANNGGAHSVLINRTDIEKDYGQEYTIKSLVELLDMI